MDKIVLVILLMLFSFSAVASDRMDSTYNEGEAALIGGIVEVDLISDSQLQSECKKLKQDGASDETTGLKWLLFLA